MDRTHLVLAASLALIGCNTESQTPPVDTPIKREISASLRAQCPGITAARTLDEPSPSRSAAPRSNTVLDSIHNQDGELVAIFSAPFLWSIEGPIYVPWDGKSEVGSPLPKGNYFHFVEIRDSTGSIARRDSVCIVLENDS